MAQAEQKRLHQKRKYSLIQAEMPWKSIPSLYISGNGVIEVECCKQITQYQHDLLEMDLGNMRVQLKGNHFQINRFSQDSLEIHGMLFTVEFIYGE